jgi:hypothetical protein
LLTFSGLTYLSEISFSIVNQSLVYLFVLLEQLQQFDFNQWHYTQTSLIDLALFILLVCVAILPKALKLRWLSVLVLGLMILIPNPKMDDNSVLISRPLKTHTNQTKPKPPHFSNNLNQQNCLLSRSGMRPRLCWCKGSARRKQLDYAKLMVNENYSNKKIIAISGAGPSAVTQPQLLYWIKFWRIRW